MTIVNLIVNGDAVSKTIEPRTSLADLLRGSCGLTGTHLGCEHGVCGACTVNVDGVPVRSCITFAAQVDGSDVRTIEGYEADAVMEQLRAEFTKQHALQCGFCTPGMLLTARDIVSRLGACGEARIREELAGNLCRCTGYAGIVQAVMNVCSAALPEAASTARIELQSKSVSERKIPNEVTTTAAVGTPDAGKMTHITKAFVVEAELEHVWEVFRELPSVASCIPGAELKSYSNDSFEGQISVDLGPIRARVEGSGRYAFDEGEKAGKVQGAGRDQLSRSRVQGLLEFKLSPRGQDCTNVDVAIAFAIQGMLAQLARGPVIDSLVSLILKQFAAEARAKILGETAGKSSGRLGVFDLIKVLLASLRRN